MMFVLTEALDAVASKEVRERILDRALAVHGTQSVPESGAPLRDFVDRALKAAIVSCLGEATADHVLADLEPIVQMAEADEAISEVRPVTPVKDAWDPQRSERPTRPAPEGFDVMSALDVRIPPHQAVPFTPLPPPPTQPPAALEPNQVDLGEDRPHSDAPEFPDVADLAMSPGPIGPVVLASSDPDAAIAFQAWFERFGGVEIVEDGIDLLDRLSAGECPSIVVLDCREADFGAATVASVTADNEVAPLLVLWGATPELEEEIALAADAVRCLPVGADMSAEDLAKRCLAAV
jgi:hypothetical protein